MGCPRKPEAGDFKEYKVEAARARVLDVIHRIQAPRPRTSCRWNARRQVRLVSAESTAAALMCMTRMDIFKEGADLGGPHPDLR